MNDVVNLTNGEKLSLDDLLTCSICYLPIIPDDSGWNKGNNAEPVNSGRCCNSCNTNVVLNARLNVMRMRDKQ